MANNRPDKSFEDRTESFSNTAANLGCGMIMWFFIGLFVFTILIIIFAIVVGTSES